MCLNFIANFRQIKNFLTQEYLGYTYLLYRYFNCHQLYIARIVVPETEDPELGNIVPAVERIGMADKLYIPVSHCRLGGWKIKNMKIA